MKVKQFLNKFLYASSSIKFVYLADQVGHELLLQTNILADPMNQEYSYREELNSTVRSLQELRAGGVREVNGVPLTEGKLRTAMARLLEISETKIAQLEAVNKNLIPELMERIKDGTLAFSAAYQLAGLPKEEQERHAEAPQPITEKQAREEREAQKRKELAARYAERECPVSGCFCDNAENLAGYYRDGATAGCPGCCANCNNAATCDNGTSTQYL